MCLIHDRRNASQNREKISIYWKAFDFFSNARFVLCFQNSLPFILTMGSAASKRKDWLEQTLDDHESGINCMALSHDQTVLATGSDDHSIRLWSTKTTPIECLSAFVGHTDYITDILIYENYLVSASSDQTARKWDMTTGQCLFICTGHTSLINRIIAYGK